MCCQCAIRGGSRCARSVHVHRCLDRGIGISQAPQRDIGTADMVDTDMINAIFRHAKAPAAIGPARAAERCLGRTVTPTGNEPRPMGSKSPERLSCRPWPQIASRDDTNVARACAQQVYRRALHRAQALSAGQTIATAVVTAYGNQHWPP